MNAAIPIERPSANSELLIQTRLYLIQRENGLQPSQELEAAWRVFYDLYSRKIGAFAITCGVTQDEFTDCVQEVWRELLVRLPTLQIDPSRGQFDTWLFSIVQGKSVDLHRSRKRQLLRGGWDALQNVADTRPNPSLALEDEEMVALAWNRLRMRLSECNFQILQMRLVKQQTVAEVAEKLDLSHEQVWYRYHRARRELEEIGSELKRGRQSSHSVGDPPHEKEENDQEIAQGRAVSSVSRYVLPGLLSRQGSSCVDYIFQRLELGRRELNPEWKVEWNCDNTPRPSLYIRKMAIVAYAEICGFGEFISTNWPRIVNAAIAAGVAAGIATIIATPTAALSIFQTEFFKQLQGKGIVMPDEVIQVALSAKVEANGLWSECES